MNELGYKIKVPIEMHYTVIPMGTSKVNSSRVFHSQIALEMKV